MLPEKGENQLAKVAVIIKLYKVITVDSTRTVDVATLNVGSEQR